MTSKNLSKPGSTDASTSGVITQTLAAALEGITGLAASDKQALLLSLGRILQRIRGGKFLAQLQAEWEDYRSKGRVRDSYIESEQGRECLQELLDFLDGDSPDQLRFQLLKHAFLKSASENPEDHNPVLPQQYMRMIRSLSYGEALLLFATYRSTDTHESANDWLQGMANSSPLRFPELVELHEQGLMDKNLLTGRVHSDRSGIRKGVHGRLTGFGYGLCRFVEADEIDLPSDRDA